MSAEGYVTQSIHAPGEHIRVGDVLSLVETYCKRVIETASVKQFVGALETDTTIESVHPESLLFAQRSHIDVRVRVSGDVYGTICSVTDDTRTVPVDGAEIALVQLVAEWVGSGLVRAQRQRALGVLDDRLESLVDATPPAVVALDSDRTVTRRNADAEATFGWSVEESLEARHSRPTGLRIGPLPPFTAGS